MPFPWLARAARVIMVLVIGAWACAVGATVLPARVLAPWWQYPRSLLNDWSRLTTVGERVELALRTAENFAADSGSPIGVLLAGWLLRAAAAGYLRVGGPPARAARAMRWPAVAVMALAVAHTAAGVYRWAYYPHGDPNGTWNVGNRIRWAVMEGMERRVSVEFQPGFHWTNAVETPCDAMYFPHVSPRHDPADYPRRAVMAACWEGSALFSTIRWQVLVFLLCGVVYCLARSPADED